MKHRHIMVALAILLIALSACTGKKTEAEENASANTSTEEATAQTATGDSMNATPAQPVEFAGAHILIQYKGSQRADSTNHSDQGRGTRTGQADRRARP